MPQGGRIAGRVETIHVYPVRSLAGSRLPAVEVAPDGLAGDRAWTVVGEDDQPLRGKEAPAIRDVVSSGDPEADAATLTSVLGRPVRVAPTPTGSGKVGAVHLVSAQAIERAAAGDVPEGCSAEDPRANLVLSLEHDDERSWVGLRLRIGTVVLDVTRTPKHCIGVYAEVRTPGELRVGDDVQVEEPGHLGA